MADIHQDQSRALQPDLYLQLLQFVSRRVSDANVAEDITQDVLERFMRQSPNSVRNPLAWLYRVARNAVIDHYRTRKQHEPLHGSTFEIFDTDTSGVPNQATQELAVCLQPMIDSLPTKYSDALRQVEINGLSQVAAAQRENISVSAMKSRVQRGRRKLANALNDCCNVSLSPTGAIIEYDQGSQCS